MHGYARLRMQVVKFEEVRKRMALSREGLHRLIRKDESFPKPFKYSSTRQGNLYFCLAEIDAWLEVRKSESK